MATIPSLKTYRQTTAKEAGRFDTVTANATGHTASVVYIDELASSLAISDSIRDYWFFMPGVAAADQIRVIADFAPGTGAVGSGYVTLDRPLSSASVANSQPCELHGSIYPKEFTGLISAGLLRCFIETEFGVPVIAGNVRHSCATAAPWLQDDSWVRWVGLLNAGETRDKVDPFQDPNRYVYGNAQEQDGTVYLNHSPRTLLAGQTLQVKAVKPAYYACAPAGGSYGAQSGLILDTDIAPVDESWVAFSTLLIAARRGSTETSVTVRPEIREDESRFALLYDDARDQHFQCPELTFMRSRFSSFGPSSGGAWGWDGPQRQ